MCTSTQAFESEPTDPCQIEPVLIVYHDDIMLHTGGIRRSARLLDVPQHPEGPTGIPLDHAVHMQMMARRQSLSHLGFEGMDGAVDPDILFCFAFAVEAECAITEQEEVLFRADTLLPPLEDSDAIEVHIQSVLNIASDETTGGFELRVLEGPIPILVDGLEEQGANLSGDVPLLLVVLHRCDQIPARIHTHMLGERPIDHASIEQGVVNRAIHGQSITGIRQDRA